MLNKKTSKFCEFFTLMILVNISKADIDMNPAFAGFFFGDGYNSIIKTIPSNVISTPQSKTNVAKIPVTINRSNNTLVSSNAENTTSTASFTNFNKLIKQVPPTVATVVPAQICRTPGVQAHESDCTKYYKCSLVEGFKNKSFHLVAKSCPKNQAFNIELKRCSRDISSCPLNITCQDKGIIADPIRNNSYYLCEPRIIGSGFRIFHVNCGLYEIFYWRVRKCDIDLEYLPYHRWDQPKDIGNVKAELKILREQDKLKLKAERKLQKEIYLKAVQDAKQEAANFICVNKGYFASKIGNKFYISCDKKNDKLEAISMQCGVRGTFYPELRKCVYTHSNDDKIFNDDEDED